MKVSIGSQKLVFDKFFKIEQAELSYERFNGKMSDTVTRLSFERGDAVAAIIFNKDSRKVILVNQFKYPTYKKTGGWITEVMAGILNQGENAEEAIHRELLEETGYTTSRLRSIGTFYVSPGGSSERIILYYAEVSDTEKVADGGGLEDEQEDIKLVAYSLPELWQAYASGEIVDAKTIIGILWLQSNLDQLGITEEE
ncbi:NUDIX domain-containing protein [Stenomitos frigidus]|uniref:NUDIX hydrolase n=1 Tax=Stenomitos frigidus ULC18 TaxID=2107698 RepID=A0A2T1DYE6_9CYAN|nr:NUDIX hydrolase [Stenomitos frigidus]PSB25502.1 NUDIX hydrolase [Stenomitos frigidus ULC18]